MAWGLLAILKIGLVFGRGMGYNQSVFNMCMLDEIFAKWNEMYAVAKWYKAERLWIFGSCIRKVAM